MQNQKSLKVYNSVASSSAGLRSKISKNEPLLSWILLFMLALIWGSSFILMKNGLKVYSPDQVASLRIFAAFLVLSPLALRSIRSIPRAKIKYVVISGLAGNLIPAFLFALAQTQLSSSITGILNSLTPIFTLILGALFFSFQVSRFKTAGLVIGLVGSLMLALTKADGGFGEINSYVLLVAFATLCYGFSVNLIKKYLQDEKPLLISSLSLFSVGLFAGIYLFNTNFVFRLTEIDGGIPAFLYVVLLGVMGSAVALVLFYKLVQMTTPIFASSVTYLIPLIAIIWGLLDNETLLMMHYAGMALILAGVYIVNKAK